VGVISAAFVPTQLEDCKFDLDQLFVMISIVPVRKYTAPGHLLLRQYCYRVIGMLLTLNHCFRRYKDAVIQARGNTAAQHVDNAATVILDTSLSAHCLVAGFWTLQEQ